MHSCLARRASLLLGKLALALCWLGCGSLALLLALRGELGRLCSCPSVTQKGWAPCLSPLRPGGKGAS